VPVVNLAAFSASNLTAQWQPALDSLNALNFPRDVAPGAFSGGREPIPRFDLPYGTLRWQATTGDRAQQGRLSGSPTPDYVKIRMPTWAGNTNPSPLSADEHAAVQAMKATP
jgi:hypothetical protein